MEKVDIYKSRLRMELAIERLTGKSASPNFMNQGYARWR